MLSKFAKKYLRSFRLTKQNFFFWGAEWPLSKTSLHVNNKRFEKSNAQDLCAIYINILLIFALNLLSHFPLGAFNSVRINGLDGF